MSNIFLDITPCSALKFNGCFGGTCHLRRQDRRISQSKSSMEKASGRALLARFNIVRGQSQGRTPRNLRLLPFEAPEPNKANERSWALGLGLPGFWLIWGMQPVAENPRGSYSSCRPRTCNGRTDAHTLQVFLVYDCPWPCTRNLPLLGDYAQTRACRHYFCFIMS
jgi:hypothetical protein